MHSADTHPSLSAPGSRPPLNNRAPKHPQKTEKQETQRCIALWHTHEGEHCQARIPEDEKSSRREGKTDVEQAIHLLVRWDTQGGVHSAESFVEVRVLGKDHVLAIHRLMKVFIVPESAAARRHNHWKAVIPTSTNDSAVRGRGVERGH